MSLPTKQILAALILIVGCGEANLPRSTNDEPSAAREEKSPGLQVGDTVAGLQIPVLLQADGKTEVS